MIYLKENRVGSNQLEVHIDRMTHRSFLKALEEENANKRATQKFLMCKAAAERRKLQAELLKKQGVDTSDIQRMVIRLETSMAAHKRAMARNN